MKSKEELANEYADKHYSIRYSDIGTTIDNKNELHRTFLAGYEAAQRWVSVQEMMRCAFLLLW